LLLRTDFEVIVVSGHALFWKKSTIERHSASWTSSRPRAWPTSTPSPLTYADGVFDISDAFVSSQWTVELSAVV
jgi:hypothetical protein